jgi:hypothetical protein
MAAPKRLAKGTIQYVPIKVTDALKDLTTLTGKDLRYDLFAADEGETPVITNASADNQVLMALPLIDTTTLAEGYYDIYIHFASTPQTPRLGPFRILVD